jgi:proteasome alpha subunit
MIGRSPFFLRMDVCFRWSIEKIFQIDKHIGCATSGLVADARVLVDRARIEAQMAMVTYNERISVETLVKSICDFKQTYTQYGGVRPFGTALLIAGVDSDGPGLYETDPSGALMSYNAGSIGRGREAANEILEQNYKTGMTMTAAIKLGIRALYEATEGELNADAIEMGAVSKGGEFQKVDRKGSCDPGRQQASQGHPLQQSDRMSNSPAGPQAGGNPAT